MRGRDRRGLLEVVNDGITPACAGKSATADWYPPLIWDHPRVCGEEPLLIFARAAVIGSPPRVRGRGRSHHRLCRRARITPACAGKRIYGPVVPARTKDHPRVCGEEPGQPRHRVYRKGSPPRVRGRAIPLWGNPPIRRITPACAGKSLCGLKSAACGQDHPRVCGEEVSQASTEVSRTGSPPRVRGRAARARKERGPARITPACAGKSRCRPGKQKSCKDHPRVCGEEPAG